jgi:ribosomal protein L22
VTVADEKDKQKKAAGDKPKPKGRSTAAKPKPAAKKAEPKAAAKAGTGTGEKKDEAASKQGARKPAAKKAAAAKAEPKQKAKAPARRRGAAKEEAKPAAAPRRAGRQGPVSRPVVRAQAKYVRSSARKARLVMDHVRGKSVADARALLRHSPRGIARDVDRLLASAVANAENNHDLVGDDLFVKEIYADEGPTLRRFRPRALGRATRIRKRTSHLTVALSPKE